MAGKGAPEPRWGAGGHDAELKALGFSGAERPGARAAGHEKIVRFVSLVDDFQLDVCPALDDELVRGDVKADERVHECDAGRLGAGCVHPLGDDPVEAAQQRDDSDAEQADEARDPDHDNEPPRPDGGEVPTGELLHASSDRFHTVVSAQPNTVVLKQSGMPKLVDHEQRRRELGEAVWRVIRRDGVEGATVRAVAAEAGWSPGALRHYFTTQSELLAFAMRLVVERVEKRVAAIEPAADRRAAVEDRLRELMPLDNERRAENEVWLAFTSRALIDPPLRALHGEVHDALHAACASALAALEVTDPAVCAIEAARLHALIDGLAVHAALRPDLISPNRLLTILGAHLDALGGTESPRTPEGRPRRRRAQR